MSNAGKYIALVVLILFPFHLKGQFDVNSKARIENGRILYTLDPKWNADQRKKITKTFDIDSIVLVKALSAKPSFIHDSIEWRCTKLPDGKIELSRSINALAVPVVDENNVLLLEDNFLHASPAGINQQVRYGVNRFTEENIFSYRNGEACINLPDFENAKLVFISGSFNNWNTTSLPMKRTESGWTICIKLRPGKHYYKFLVDGRWVLDPYNKNKEELREGKNSFFFCYNFTFRINGQINKKKAFLAGSFNNWNVSELPMIRTKTGWILPIYLREGTHFYKFILDNEWIVDPGNNNVRLDANGNLNSFVELGEKVSFFLNNYKSARVVVLSGNFNNWSRNELVMNKTASGWELKYALPPGNYEYKFIVDGRWIIDPENPYTIGRNELTNSYAVFKPNYLFRLKNYQNAKEVIVTGSFNKWNESGYRMQKTNGEWILPIRLSPGKHLYKFIIDGKWIMDPDNKLWEENEYGTGNSILWIAP